MSVAGAVEADEVDGAVLAALRNIVGPVHARAATAEDAIEGVQPRFVAAPGSVAQAGALLAWARGAGLAVAPCGGGSKRGWGNRPARLDLVVSTARLDRVLEHAAGDLVARVEAGVTLTRLQEALVGAGQMLALDPPERGATLGGIVAANASGPLRLRYGTVRDLLIGITVVLADGTIARAGGKVVKNVAGYDLAKLFTGSLGTLGLIVEAIFRLHPLPAARRLVLVEVESPAAAGAAVQSIKRSVLVPSALELEWRGERGALAALFEGIAPGVAAQAEAALELLRPHGTVHMPAESEVDATWQRLTAPPWEDGMVGLKINHVLTDLPRVLRDVQDLARAHGVAERMSGHAGSGVTLVGLSGGDAAACVATITALRERAVAGGGSLVVLQAPAEVKTTIDVWGPPGQDALPLMRRVKERFDPAGMMNPGRFVGGI